MAGSACAPRRVATPGCGRAAAMRWSPQRPARYSTSCPTRELFHAELGAQQLVEAPGFGLAAGLLHHLADEPADGLGLVLHLGGLTGVAGDQLVDDGVERARVRDLLEPLFFDDLAGAALAGPHAFEDVLGDLRGDHALLDQRDQLGDAVGADGALGDVEAAG